MISLRDKCLSLQPGQMFGIKYKGYVGEYGGTFK